MSLKNHLLDITLLIYEFAFSNQAFFVSLYKSVFDLKLNNGRASPNPIGYLVAAQIMIPIIVTLTQRPIYYFQFLLYPISNDIYTQKIQHKSQIKVHQNFRAQCDPWISRSVIEDQIRE